ncbi:hypothetical protein P9851_03555 [Geobacillus stearothermophilus]|uniref:hypothetical protein n=1 Tax=Geobacillus stearothermophilus TaxID=1422 RepID=UPI002E203198|nr:hypothetical protein [Geobacillus stearothermophilus]
MNYETIILELMTRVQALEQKVKILEEKNKKYDDVIEMIKNNKDFEEQDEEIKITRSIARQQVMNKIANLYKYLDVKKGNRATRADIILTVNNGENKGEQFFGKFYYSKSHLEYPAGWHTVKAVDLENDNLDFHIFTVSHEDKFYNFLFTHEELKQYVQQKKMDSSDQYYFYFQVVNGKAIENRDGERNVQSNFENWKMFEQLIK